MQQDIQIESRRHNCPMRARAAKAPRSLLALIWRWHTSWRPGWKAYTRELQSKELDAPNP